MGKLEGDKERYSRKEISYPSFLTDEKRIKDILRRLYIAEYLIEKKQYDYADLTIQSAINLLIDFLNLSISDADQIKSTARIIADEMLCAKKVEFKDNPLKEIEEKIERGKERRSRIVQELFKLYDRVREFEKELEDEIVEILKRLDEDDYIIRFVGATLEDDGLEYWTQRGKEVYVRVDGSIEVRDRRGKPILRV